MRRLRRPAFILLVVLSAALAGLAVSEARRDTTPPKLYIEAPARAEVGSQADVLITANEPVTYHVRYGGLDQSKVTQNWNVPLTALAGSNAVDIVATDGSGNTTDNQVLIDGVAAPVPQLQTEAERTAGDPLGVHVSWPADAATVTAVSVTFDGKPQRIIQGADDVRSIVPIPLSTAPGSYPLVVSVTDEFGITHTDTRSIAVGPLSQKVALIHLPPKVLATDTPEAWAQEQQALDAAFAQGAPKPEWQAPFEIPVKGVESAGFGSARRYVPGGPVSYHTGIDLAVPEGTPIHAANDGTVVMARKLPISGNIVAIDHGDGVFSLYFHQSKILVHDGEQVKRGQVIGLVGSTGLSTGPHLHWQMDVDGVPTNPLAWVGRRYP
jgi:murein DD-endopeptidase MepM/ murein hydrolase activator NlpD